MSPRLPRVYLVRHGETEWSLNGRHTGVSDIPLTSNGEQVILRSAPRFVGKGKLVDPASIAHIFVSPRQRAHKTFKLLRSTDLEGFEQAGIEPEITEEVAEWLYAEYEGLKPAEIQALNPGWSAWIDGFPGGETAQQMADRVDRTVNRIRDLHRQYWTSAKAGENPKPCDVLIFSHGHYTRCFLSRWMGTPLTTGELMACDPGSVSVCGYRHHTFEERTLLGLNLHSYLMEG